jgi:hypothetical protein
MKGSIMPPARLAPLLLLPLAAGCASLGLDDRADIPPGLSPVGQTLNVRAANGAVSRMTFREDGTVTARFGERAIQGEWQIQEAGLCFRWGRAPVECWPYTRPFPRGRTVAVTSTRGNVVRVTRQ